MQPVLARWGVLDRLLKAGAERRAGTRWFDAEGTHIVTVPVPQHDDCGGAFLFLNHEKIGDILLNTAEEAGAVNITGLSEWSLTRAAGIGVSSGRQLINWGRPRARCWWRPTGPHRRFAVG